MALDLQRYLDSKPVHARAQSLAYRLRKYAGRHRWALVSGTLVAATLAAALGIVLWQSRQFVQEGARAQALKDFVVGLFEHAPRTPDGVPPLGRALCRERVCQSVSLSLVTGTLTNK